EHNSDRLQHGRRPRQAWLVASLSRPGGNITGFNVWTVELAAKKLGLVRELLPGASRIAVLVNPASATDTAVTGRDARAAARAIGQKPQVLKASRGVESDAFFAALGQDRPAPLLTPPAPPFTTRHVQLVQLAAYHRIPAIYTLRQTAEIGGLISYGTSLT